MKTVLEVALFDVSTVAGQVGPFVLLALCFALAMSMLAAVAVLVFRRSRPTEDGDPPISNYVLIFFTLPLVALLAGHMSGSARETVIGAVTPVLMSGVGFLFLFSVVQGKLPVAFAASCVLAFSVSFYAGVNMGAWHRYVFEEAEKEKAKATSPNAFTSRAGPFGLDELIQRREDLGGQIPLVTIPLRNEYRVEPKSN